MAASASDSVQRLLAQLQTAGSAYAERKPGAREELLSLSSALTAALELPSETIQRIGWAEVSLLERPGARQKTTKYLFNRC